MKKQEESSSQKDSNDHLETEEEEEDKNSKSSSGRWHKDHPREQIIGEFRAGIQTRKRALHTYSLLSSIEPKNVVEASQNESWVKEMEEELTQIEKNETWGLVLT